MPDRTPVPLTPVAIDLDSPEFEVISAWPFVDSFVGRLLREDVPQRVQFNSGRVWIYRDPDSRIVGFGTMDVCEDYREYTAGRPHPYIPLLAVNPGIKSLGYGTTIVRHLIGEAALLACGPGKLHNVVFLDVYTTSVNAIKLYDKCGFSNLAEEPISDPLEGGKSYIIMAKRVSLAPT